MLYRILSPLVMACALVLMPGCATTATQFNSQVATADRSVQLVQTTATALLRAQKITRAKDQDIQRRVQAAHDLLVVAKAAYPADPVGASVKLKQAQTELATLKTETGVQE